MRALDPEVKDAIWAAFEARIPVPIDNHPLGCHRARASDRDCFDVIVVRLATGCSWEDAERLTGNKVSDTTARARRDEWIAAGIFEALNQEALAGYDKVIGLDLSDVAVDGSLHKSPCGGEGTGKNPTDRAKLGWKWSILTDQSQRFDPARTDPRRCRQARSPQRHRDALARPRLRLRCHDRAPRRAWNQRLGDRQEAQERRGQSKEPPADGDALASGADQQLALELRSTP
jgi:transposase